VITAGSSASARDLTAQVINTLGHPGVLVHGINIRPGKPTILAVCNGKAVIGLPGNPVSALVVARMIVIPVVQSLLNLRDALKQNFSNIEPCIQARLTINVPSQAGREDWIPVRIIATSNGFEAEPLFGKSNLIFTLVRADGLICIPPDVTGRAAGDMVEVKSIHH
jgi:molybdopterin molybdotransferase